MFGKFVFGLCSKTNITDFHADPSAHYWDGKYWIYPSTDEPGSTTWRQMKRWHCYSSEDLSQWKCEGEIFSLDKVSWASEAAFAPDAMKWKGKYYFFFPCPVSDRGSSVGQAEWLFKDTLGKPFD